MGHKRINHLPAIFKELKKLKEKFPSVDIHQHIHMATAAGDSWLSDKSFLSALRSYSDELEFHTPLEDTSELERDSMNLMYMDETDDEDEEPGDIF